MGTNLHIHYLEGCLLPHPSVFPGKQSFLSLMYPNSFLLTYKVLDSLPHSFPFTPGKTFFIMTSASASLLDCTVHILIIFFHLHLVACERQPSKKLVILVSPIITLHHECVQDFTKKNPYGFQCLPSWLSVSLRMH